jgi:pimeloyl-ACP methyl ester carboxylesterase
MLHAEFAGLGAAIDRLAEAGRRTLVMRRFIDYWNGDGAWARTSPRLRGFFLDCLERVRADFAAVAGETGGRADLAGIDCPALAVMGLESPAPSLRVTEVVAEALPRAALRLIPDAGHLAPLTDPHLIDPMIADHLLAADRATRRARAA